MLAPTQTNHVEPRSTITQVNLKIHKAALVGLNISGALEGQDDLNLQVAESLTRCSKPRYGILLEPGGFHRNWYVLSKKKNSQSFQTCHGWGFIDEIPNAINPTWIRPLIYNPDYCIKKKGFQRLHGLGSSRRKITATSSQIADSSGQANLVLKLQIQ